MNASIAILRRLVEVNKKFNQKFKDIIAEKQGIETHLAKTYAPITAAQAVTTKAVEATSKSIQEQKQILKHFWLECMKHLY